MTQPNWGLSPVPFIPGQELNRRFYAEAVAPLLAQFFPGLPHTAGLIGYGSDVLGFDTPMSRDHMWGPRLVLLLPEADFDAHRAAVDAALRQHLPLTFCGYPTHFGPSDEAGVRLLQFIEQGPVDHLVALNTLPGFLQAELGLTPGEPLTETRWLTFPEQKLLAVTAGAVYHDDLGLEGARQSLAYYPDEVWRYLLACQWTRISQEEAFVGRTGDLGDDLGSRVITARLVQDLMRLAFLQARRYAPYAKWFGTAFAQLPLAEALLPDLRAALAADNWPAREAALCAAARQLAEQHNALGLTPPLDTQPRSFHGRPFTILDAGRFASALQATLQPDGLRSLPPFGSVNQFCSSTDVLEAPAACATLGGLFKITT